MATNNLKKEARFKILGELANGLAQEWKTGMAFGESGNWHGYNQARQSWEKAMWTWIEANITAEKEKQWRRTLLANKARFSPDSDHSTSATNSDMERYLQTYLVRRAYFLGGLRHRKEGDPDWFKGFAFYFHIAALIDDDEIFDELARLACRKPSRDTGRRSLRFWLICHWIPGCLWAITNNGISELLVWPDSARSTGRSEAYSEGRIRNVISELALWRPPKPLYWGFNSKHELVQL